MIFILFYFYFCFLLRSITKKIKDFAIQKRVKDPDRSERTTMKDLSYVLIKFFRHKLFDFVSI